jgi:hypothetical protein
VARMLIPSTSRARTSARFCVLNLFILTRLLRGCDKLVARVTSKVEAQGSPDNSDHGGEYGQGSLDIHPPTTRQSQNSGDGARQ